MLGLRKIWTGLFLSPRALHEPALTHSFTPILLGLAAAITWGAADFAGGLAARRGRPGRVVLVAHGTSVVLLGLLVYALHAPQLPPFATAWGLLSGVSGGFALMLFYEALALGEMGLSAALAGVLTAALPVAVACIRQGRPGGPQLAGFAVAAVAIALIAWSPAESTQVRGLILASLAGLGFGVQLVVLHLASEQGSVLRSLALSRAGGAAAGLAAVGLAAVRRRGVLPEAGPKRSAATNQPTRAGRASFVFLMLAAVAGLLDTTGNGFYMVSALAGRLDVAAVLASLYPGATILLAAWILKERTTRTQAAGMVLALVAVVLISL